MKKYTIKEKKPKNQNREYRSPQDIEYHRICDNKVTLYKRENSDNYYFRFYISTDKRYMKRSTGTVELAQAINTASLQYFQVQADISRGKKIFGVSILEAGDMYLQHRYEDVQGSEANITLERYQTIKTQITKHIIPFINQKYDKDFRVINLKRNDFYDYEDYRLNKTKGDVIVTCT